MVNVFQTQGRGCQGLIYYSKHVEKINRHHLLLNAQGIDNYIEVAVRSRDSDRVMEMTESHGFDAQQQRPLPAFAAQDDGASRVAMYGDRKQRTISRRRGVARYQQDRLNVFIGRHPADCGLNSNMKTRASANFKTQDHRIFSTQIRADFVCEGEALLCFG